ncbi:CMRF35-like molecule 3 [Clinocottus analis]|uniref:CMRF35-like molecule 3 n=1 Tax=Clinocottus analis TaxID=304258 RepID=UPI0035BFEA2E
MINIYVYSCLLFGLSFVEMKILNVNGRVGQSVTFECSDWSVWFDGKRNVKYFCYSPCSEDRHIIIKAAYGKTTHKNRIQLNNQGEGLFVTLKNLQKSDSKTYFCGLERFGGDSYIKVNLEVMDAQIHSPKTTPKTVIVGSTLSFSVTNSSTMSSSSSDVTDVSTSHMTFNTTPPTAAQASGSDVPYLVTGVIAIITLLIVLLTVMNKMRKQKIKVVSSADTQPEDAQEDVQYDEIRPEHQTDTNVLYANYELAAESGNRNSNDLYTNLLSRCVVDSRGACAESRVSNDLLYAVAQLPENESLYSLAQPSRAT